MGGLFTHQLARRQHTAVVFRFCDKQENLNTSCGLEGEKNGAVRVGMGVGDHM